VRILHTSDWHVGKRLGRYDRTDEYAAAIDEVVDIADAEQAELVIVAGDVFDRPQPPVDALRLAFDGLARLATKRPVVAVAGNHDSAEFFEALAPFLVGSGIHLVGDIKHPDSGGILELETTSGLARVACFPFLRQGRTVDFMAETGQWYGAYAERVRAICDSYAAALAAGDGVAVLAAHFMVTGARIGGGAAGRGERELHIGEAYAATSDAIPKTLSYVALGHIHAPQPVPGANVPAEYAGSLLPLDFGEAGETKRVVMVDAQPGRPAGVTSIPLSSGRPLLRATGTWDELVGREDLDGAYVDLTVLTDGPDPALAEKARERFAFIVKVRAEYQRAEVNTSSLAERTLPELYDEFHQQTHGGSPTPEVAAAFGELLDEVMSASS